MTTRPFGLSISTATAQDIAYAALRERRGTAEGVALVVTPNIEHVANLRRSKELARAYAGAAVVVCDGWPVQRYAKIRGLDVQRVTGVEITARLMRAASYSPWHRLFFVVDSDATRARLVAWANDRGITGQVSVFVPPFGFIDQDRVCHEMADAVARHGTTLLLMCVGSPRSEVFVDSYRAFLPPCWAFCIGQAVKVELGMFPAAPHTWQRIGCEWLWRLVHEPKRLAWRYTASPFGFAMAIIDDLRHGRIGSPADQREVA
jgi:N-acetylglucosaminyldiphosphoundecaprenol N-acetyl-beta-D-mannosaminyltransferase